MASTYLACICKVLDLVLSEVEWVELTELGGVKMWFERLCKITVESSGLELELDSTSSLSENNPSFHKR